MKSTPLRRSTGYATASVPVLRPRRCKQCGEQYQPTKQMQQVCGVTCARLMAEAKRAKEREKKAMDEKRQDRAKLEAMKTLPTLFREAQAAINAFVRMRDAHQPCISCGKPPGDLSQFHAGRDAGHYRSVGSAPHMRFVEANIHAQCVQCNQYKAGNAVDYRRGLIARIGLAAVEALESDQTPRKYSRDEVRGIRDTYRAKVREMKKGME